MKVSEIMNSTPAVAYGGNTVQDAAELMAKTERGLLVIMDNEFNKKVIGVLSNKDIINKVIATRASTTAIHIHEVMNLQPLFVKSDTTTSQAMAMMRKYKIKRLLVIEDGVLQGIVSSNDILDGMLRYKKALLDMAIDF